MMPDQAHHIMNALIGIDTSLTVIMVLYVINIAFRAGASFLNFASRWVRKPTAG